MSSSTTRRSFLSRLVSALLATTFLGGCTGRKHGEGLPRANESTGTDYLPPASAFESELSKNRQLPRDLVMKLLDQKVDHYMQLSHHCAQSSFLALKEQFGLDGDEIVKALTPLTGIAERGETCGAVTGPLMVLGLIYGRDQNRLGDWETYRESLIPAGSFCTKFEQAYGSTMCHEIQNVKFGKCFRLTDPAELKEFQEADATEQCSEVVRNAVHIAANIILDDFEIHR